MRNTLVTVGIAVTCSLVVAAAFTAFNRPIVLTGTQSAAVGTITPAILTSGDAIVSKKPDLAIVYAGVQSEQSTAAGAQSDLATKANKLITRIKALGVPDSDLSTTGYWVGPVYDQTGRSITDYRASEDLVAKWHTVDSVGKVLDAIVQEGGATNVSVSFQLNDPKPAQAEARSLAIADARAKASAMASAAGVRLGQVIQISDLTTQTRYPAPFAAPDGATKTQVPVGQLDVQVSVEVDFAIA